MLSQPRKRGKGGGNFVFIFLFFCLRPSASLCFPFSTSCTAPFLQPSLHMQPPDWLLLRLLWFGLADEIVPLFHTGAIEGQKTLNDPCVSTIEFCKKCIPVVVLIESCSDGLRRPPLQASLPGPCFWGEGHRGETGNFSNGRGSRAEASSLHTSL